MKEVLAIVGLAGAIVFFVGCGDEAGPEQGEVGEVNVDDGAPAFVNAQGLACEPDMATYVPSDLPGDNMDDEHSGKVDCIGDGDSGQGNDKWKCPEPGCDAEGCCENREDEDDDGDDECDDCDDDDDDDDDEDDCDGGKHRDPRGDEPDNDDPGSPEDPIVEQ